MGDSLMREDELLNDGALIPGPLQKNLREILDSQQVGALHAADLIPVFEILPVGLTQIGPHQPGCAEIRTGKYGPDQIRFLQIRCNLRIFLPSFVPRLHPFFSHAPDLLPVTHTTTWMNELRIPASGP